MKNCLNCGTETKKPKYCCRTCSAVDTNKKTPKRRTKRTCIVCGDRVATHRDARCPTHKEDYKNNHFKNKTLGEYQERQSVKGKHASWVNSHVRTFARSWLSHLKDKPCAKCGYTKHVELAHIKAVSSFELTATLGEINAPSNIIQLCPNCHWEFDNLPRVGFFTSLLEPREGIEPFDFHPSV